MKRYILEVRYLKVMMTLLNVQDFFFFGFSIVIYGSCTFFQLGLTCTSILLVHIFFLAVNLIFWSLSRHAFFCGLCKVSRSDQMIQCHPRFVLVIQIKVLTTYVWKGYCLLSARRRKPNLLINLIDVNFIYMASAGPIKALWIFLINNLIYLSDQIVLFCLRGWLAQTVYC